MQIAPDGGNAGAPVNLAAVAANARLAAGHGTLGDQSVVMKGSAANLVAAAGTGFTLEPETAAALIASCDESLTILNDLEYDLAYVRQAPQLGDLSVARTVSAFTQNVANDPQGIVAGVYNLKATIVQMREAYQKAAANYQNMDQQVADSVNKLAAEVAQQNTPAPRHGPMRAS